MSTLATPLANVLDPRLPRYAGPLAQNTPSAVDPGFTAPEGIDPMGAEDHSSAYNPANAETARVTQAPALGLDVAAPTAAPAPADPYAPQRAHIHDLGESLATHTAQYAGNAAPVPHHGLLFDVAKGLTSTFSPALAESAFSGRDNRALEQFKANQARDLQTLKAEESQYGLAEKDLQNTERGDLIQAQKGYYNQRIPITDAKTTQTVGADGKTHVLQFNPDDKKFDIDLGLAPAENKQQPVYHVETGDGVYEVDPNTKTQRKIGPPSKLPHQPTEFEEDLSLFRKNPQEYQQFHTARNAGRGSANADGVVDQYGLTPVDESRLRKEARIDNTDKLTGEVDEDAAEQEFTRNASSFHKKGTNPNGPKQGDVKFLKGVPYTWDGTKYVAQTQTVTAAKGKK